MPVVHVLPQHAATRQHAITALDSAIDNADRAQHCHDAWHIVSKHDKISCHGGVQTVELHAGVVDGV